MSRVTRMLAVGGFAGLLAVLADSMLQAVALERRPWSGPVRARVEVEAPIERTWEILADIPGQVRWMPEMKRVSLVTPGPVREGSVGEATVRIFGIAVTDQVTITTFRPPTSFGIGHDGIFGGYGRIELRPGRDEGTTIVEWEEQLVPPLLPALGWLMGRPLIAWLYQRDLYLLRDLVEDQPRVAPA